MAERGDYIYIGTWFNTIGAVVTIIQAGLKAKGLNLSQETIEAMMDTVSNTVRKDPGGFHLIKTADGEHWEHVTDCGFGDQFNYGCLRFAPTDHGLYMTTANPFYGTQLYLLKNNKE